MDVYEKLRQAGLDLPPPPPKGGIYAKVKQVGNIIYVSGQGPTRDGIPLYTGKLGDELTLEEGQAAARICALNILSCLHEYLGDLNKIKDTVKLLAFVACTNQFCEQPQVVNGASSLFLDLLEERGEPTRSAIGTNALPGNIPVEMEAIFEI